jgi:hypothetical protein
MTATGLPDSSAPAAAEALESRDRNAELKPAVAAVSNGAVDVDTRHRLRRALRILLAARRRDDGGSGHLDG